MDEWMTNVVKPRSAAGCKRPGAAVTLHINHTYINVL
jgi:hypothetical protein